jgi:hypothetical protein
MYEQEANRQLHRLAKAIYVEIRKQFDCAGPSVPVVCDQAGMRNVHVEGHIDLVKVAAALSVRCCVQMPDIETVDEPGSAVPSKKSDQEDLTSAP